MYMMILLSKIFRLKIEGRLIHGGKPKREQNGPSLASANRLPSVTRLSFLKSGDFASSNHKPYVTDVS